MSIETHAGSRQTQAAAEALAGEKVAGVLAQLRADGHRITTARRAVIVALANGATHPTVEQLCEYIEARTPGVHRSTVYRTVDTLTELGVITHVHMSHGTTTYHLAGPGAGDAHLHAQCQVCGRVIDLRSDAMEAVKRALDADAGFALDPRHVALSGACRACRTD